jgi:hypothetical protein
VDVLAVERLRCRQNYWRKQFFPLGLVSFTVRVWLCTCTKTSCRLDCCPVLGTTHLAHFHCRRPTGTGLSVFLRTFGASGSVPSHWRIRRVCIPTWTARGVAVIRGHTWTSWLTPAPHKCKQRAGGWWGLHTNIGGITWITGTAHRTDGS